MAPDMTRAFPAGHDLHFLALPWNVDGSNFKPQDHRLNIYIYTIWLFNIAMENPL